jgi:hypothetical protein
MGQAETETYACGMYERVNKKWREDASKIFGGSCGFSILSGPPIFNPNSMIIGENPGFGVDDCEPHVEVCWPKRSWIADAEWDLATKLRSIFRLGTSLSILDNAIQTNFQFFKSSSIDRKSRYRWKSLPKPLRDDLDGFCAHELRGYVIVSQPNTILVLGIATFDRRATDPVTLLHDRASKRRLLVGGRIYGVPAYGILHPTGARVAIEDWCRAVHRLGEGLADT